LTIDPIDDDELLDDVVPIEMLTGHRDRFQCLPLDMVLTAGSCVVRQRQASKFGTPSSKCWDCVDGRQVQTRMDALRTENRDMNVTTSANSNGLHELEEQESVDEKRPIKERRATKAARKARRGNHSAVLNSSRVKPTGAPSLSLANPEVLADLHELCMRAERYDLVVMLGSALAASVRERKAKS
jgi:hypothetical protein